ncbi:23S rRNA (pseudouridine(1915)-N(3))-methyltransferase RlmH [Paenibacillus larvae]|uniref:Ribosomal RNA large subunit methyltransferase H n=2 Tax=Paenibacillus larvae TaxID=1464 RepID=A0AAP5JT42_9BACL|nr:23S rRNA (pseudouridine(1915)-N(3))-methyltransferase RlmH [Paenibacillus larvae]AQR78739.1 23S rRNA (pseudouridine(1915)-N(3))-methyltransferase RlmH [Paenibacillus larvae subsp. larvae]AVF24227.1 ribosomal RNA large subunit methyltransferase H [Paenibacillus larvae subsp. larvae]ETK29065.1 ribosomal RNA large subunit methyltransferase H [Paenibacillus larvae subsp. larvae DSM 25719]MCY7475274.1 23S rRNA (pseudouridine(1915)-N(3))-methyltransferase RlmH [Paenibacillus larvae]MCY7488456.1 2
MHIQIVTVGKLKEKYLVQGITEYVKRLGPYAKVQMIEVPDEKAPETLSETQAQQLDQLAIYGRSQVAFVIGGSLGLSDKVIRRADMRLSFGRMTMPHQLIRLVLVEQIYRAFKINRGEPYHK